jgi:hypothetical protein
VALSLLSFGEGNQLTNPNQRIVSFSLYGNNPKFTFGAIENAKNIAKNMPGWIALFYVGNDVDKHIVSKLTELGAIIKNQESTWHKNGMFWRFKVFRDFLPEYAIIRDSDSRITARELAAVEEWIASGKSLHIMRDHPYHGIEILGGMWGVKGGKLLGIMDAAAEYKPSGQKGQDQCFLVSWVWRKLMAGEITCTAHDPFFTKNPFPAEASRGPVNEGVWFIGQVFNERDEYNSQDDVDLLVKATQAFQEK